ncbi:MAG TPA: antitoxin Xre-like helix-turn-helix domain-containing protein [Chitinophagaceae bacterium]|nr:antitoxin Xre-like helix-turn-helix domain-containing protein [Chitinophagaceae bacterium]
MVKGKKNKTGQAHYKQTSKVSKAHEALLAYTHSQFKPIVGDFDYKEFKKIADNVPFTQKEWSDILHISERTLQRYSKDNSVFNFSVADRILQVDKVIKKGVHVFGSIDKFINWIRDNPYMLEGRLSLNSLASIDGIQGVLTQLGRIEHGILA